MEIKIAYPPESIAWVINENKIAKVRIKQVEVFISALKPKEFETLIKYYADNRAFYYSESEIFGSKEALIQSL